MIFAIHFAVQKIIQFMVNCHKFTERRFLKYGNDTGTIKQRECSKPERRCKTTSS